MDLAGGPGVAVAVAAAFLANFAGGLSAVRTDCPPRNRAPEREFCIWADARVENKVHFCTRWKLRVVFLHIVHNMRC